MVFCRGWYVSSRFSEIKINKVDERGFYVCDKTGIFYLHKDDKFKLGIDVENNAFWPTKEEAERFYDEYKKNYST